jgi:thiol:disulfide interchange protein DsbD
MLRIFPKHLGRNCYCAVQALLIAAVVTVSGPVHADTADTQFLDPAVAFKFSASEHAGQVQVHYTIADGYYMYRERFAFAVKSGQATLGAPILPPGQVKYDETFNKNVETYRGDLTVTIPVTQAQGPFDLAVTSQGCADKGICYPPLERVVHVVGPALHAAGAGLASQQDSAQPTGGQSLVPTTRGNVTPLATVSSAAAAAMPDASNATQAGGTERLYSAQYAQQVLQGHSLPYVLAIFFILGMALSLLPCSLPMIPILSSIVLGEGASITRVRGFTLSLAYVLGMALIYTCFGVAAALLGQSLGAWLQNPWVLGAFAVLLTAFAASMFGAYELQLPQAWQNSVGGVSQRHSGGKLLAVFVMGALSALVVGACMTAPLFGVLAFIAQTGNAGFGAAALFAMALGLGVPLLVVGVGAGALLPRAGAWMEAVKRCFGVILLAVALWLVAPVLPDWLVMVLAALLLLLSAAALRILEPLPSDGARYLGRLLAKALGAAAVLAATLLLVGAAAGSRDVLQPLAVFVRTGAPVQAGAVAGAGSAMPFARVKSSAQLDQALKSTAQPALLDFYADWCVSCKEMEKFTFSDPRVQARLAQMNLLQSDVTANDSDDRALLKRFQLFGPPGIILFDASGREVARVVGYQPPDTFLRSLDQAAAAH